MQASSIFVIFSKYHYWLERQKIFIGYHTNTSWLNSKDFEQHNSDKKCFDNDVEVHVTLVSPIRIKMMSSYWWFSVPVNHAC